MQINLSGHHVDVTEGIRQAINSKFSKIESHYPQLDALSIILTVEKSEQSVEALTQYMGTSVAVQASDDDLYSAISNAAKKMDSALSCRKGTTKSFSREKPEFDIGLN